MKQFFFSALVAYAQIDAPAPVKSASGFMQLVLCNVLDWVFTVAIVMSIFFTLFAAFTYLTSGGNEEKVAQASRMITFIVVGVAVAILAGGLPYIIANFLRADIGTICYGR